MGAADILKQNGLKSWATIGSKIKRNTQFYNYILIFLFAPSPLATLDTDYIIGINFIAAVLQQSSCRPVAGSRKFIYSHKSGAHII